MLLNFLHAIGLTNLSDGDISRYNQIKQKGEYRVISPQTRPTILISSEKFHEDHYMGIREILRQEALGDVNRDQVVRLIEMEIGMLEMKMVELDVRNHLKVVRFLDSVTQEVLAANEELLGFREQRAGGGPGTPDVEKNISRVLRLGRQLLDFADRHVPESKRTYEATLKELRNSTS